MSPINSEYIILLDFTNKNRSVTSALSNVYNGAFCESSLDFSGWHWLQLYLKKAQVFSCEICEIFKNSYFEAHLRTTASGFGRRAINLAQKINFCSTRFWLGIINVTATNDKFGKSRVFWRLSTITVVKTSLIGLVTIVKFHTNLINVILVILSHTSISTLRERLGILIYYV